MTKTKADFIESISKGTGIPARDVRVIIETFMDEVKKIFSRQPKAFALETAFGQD